MVKEDKNRQVSFAPVSVLVLVLLIGLFVPAFAAPAWAASASHNYYKGISSDKAAQADMIAQNIAASILANPAYTTDLQKVNAAAQVVASYCTQAVYGTDANRYYRSPYGVFISHNYTCAGSTRALGRVLDYMGYTWVHSNENQNSHQWCILIMDGQQGFADGMGGFAGYGLETSGMTLPGGRVVYFAG